VSSVHISRKRNHPFENKPAVSSSEKQVAAPYEHPGKTKSGKETKKRRRGGKEYI